MRKLFLPAFMLSLTLSSLTAHGQSVTKGSDGSVTIFHKDGTSTRLPVSNSNNAFTCVASNVANVTATPTCFSGQALRVGNVVTYSTRIGGVDVITTGTGTASFQISLPFSVGVFANVGQATGSCVMDTNTTLIPTVWWAEAIIGAARLSINTRNPQEASSRDIYCHFTFTIL